MDTNLRMTMKEAVATSKARGVVPVGAASFTARGTGLHPVDGSGSPWQAYVFGTQIAEVEVDTWTGEVQVLGIWAAHDVGRAINPRGVEGQIEGSVHMGLGYALTEDFPSDPESGFPTLSTLRSLGILRAKVVPEIEVHLVEVPQPRSPYGIKGVGEIGLVPTAPAVAAALHDADGQWRRKLPMRPATD
jgi:CO/xanthine dehydrogenase Mo-binding subunit